MEVSMSKKKGIHTHAIFAELSHLSVGECMHHRWATQTAELVSQDRNEVGVEWSATWIELKCDFKIEMEVKWSWISLDLSWGGVGASIYFSTSIQLEFISWMANRRADVCCGHDAINSPMYGWPSIIASWDRKVERCTAERDNSKFKINAFLCQREIGAGVKMDWSTT
jgi:hypothetical protein